MTFWRITAQILRIFYCAACAQATSAKCGAAEATAVAVATRVSGMTVTETPVVTGD